MMLASPNDAVSELAALVRHLGANELADRLESAVQTNVKLLALTIRGTTHG